MLVVTETCATAVALLGRLMTWPIWRSPGVIPGLTASIAAGVVPYLLAMIQKVSPALTATRSLLAAVVPPGTTATTKSQYAARAKVTLKNLRILVWIDSVKAEN